jgi:hypothetical protein
MSTSTSKSPELRIVPAASADAGQVTLRIDAERPVPPPPLTDEEARLHRLAASERELDRLHSAANAEQVTLGQHMNWLIASQAIFIHAFLMVFVVSSLGVVAVNHWLLGGLALTGIFCALALHGSLDRSWKSLAMLVVQRRAMEIELATLRGRTPNLPREPPRISALAGPLFVVIWLALLVCGAAIRF